MSIGTEADTQLLNQQDEVDDYDGPRISSFQQLFQDLKNNTKLTHLDQLLNVFEKGDIRERTESNYLKICQDFEQKTYTGMMTISETDNLALSFEKEVRDYLEMDFNVNKAHLSPFKVSGWESGMFMTRDVLETALLVSGEYKRHCPPMTFVVQLTKLMIQVFPLTTIGIELRNQLRKHVRCIVNSRRQYGMDVTYDNVPFPTLSV
jgi:hypothetical protein